MNRQPTLIFHLLGLMSLLISAPPLMAQHLGPEGSPDPTISEGTHFEVTTTNDTGELVVTVDTGSTATILLEALPDVVTLHIVEPSAGPVSFTVNGLYPSAQYYLYEWNYHYYQVFTSDATGQLTFTHDLARAEHLWLRHQYGQSPVIFLDATGGDCVSVGNWDPASMTCTLTMDVADTTLHIDDPDITLDCDGRTLTVDSVNAVFIPTGSDRTTVTNCIIDAGGFFGEGIFASSNENTVVVNEITTEFGGIH